MKRLSFRYLALAVVVCLAAGCAPKVPTGKFDLLAQSTQKILKGTTETYTRIEKLQQRFYASAAAFTNKGFNKTDPLQPNMFLPSSGEDLRPRLRLREAALAKLVDYVLLLQALAKRDFAGEVDKAMDKFATGWNSMWTLLSGAGAAIPGAQVINIIPNIAKIIVRARVNHMRLQALKDVMDQAYPAIRRLAQLIPVDNKDSFLLDVTRMTNRIVAHKKWLRPRERGTQARVSIDSQIAQVFLEKDEIEKALKKLNKAIAQIPATHQEIRKALNEQPLEQVKQPCEPSALQILVEDVKPIDKFYRDLK